jgi:hypothetical protein
MRKEICAKQQMLQIRIQKILIFSLNIVNVSLQAILFLLVLLSQTKNIVDGKHSRKCGDEIHVMLQCVC